MSTHTESGEPSPARTRNPLETGPYVLRPLLEDLPLSPDGAQDDVKINCVDYFGLRNLLCVRIILERRTNEVRTQSICRYIGIRTPPFCTDPPRSSRSEWQSRLYPRLATTSCVPRRPLGVESFPARSPADPTPPSCWQSMRLVQLDRDLLLPTRTKPCVWVYTSEELQLDWRGGLE